MIIDAVRLRVSLSAVARAANDVAVQLAIALPTWRELMTDVQTVSASSISVVQLDERGNPITPGFDAASDAATDVALKAEDVAAPVPEESTTPNPVMLTRTLLRLLGSCDEYLRRHHRLFPTDDPRWANGAPITQEICTEYADNFDWDWAEGRMLSQAGRERCATLRQSRSIDNRRFGTGRARRAAIFGHVLHHHPEWRSSDLNYALSRESEAADDYALKDLRSAERNLERVQRDVKMYQQEVVRYQRTMREAEERIPNLEAEIAKLREKHAHVFKRAEQRKLNESLAEIKRLEALVVQTRENHDKLAVAFKENYGELEPMPEPTPEPVPTLIARLHERVDPF